LAYAVGTDGCFRLTITPVEGLGPEGGINAEGPGGLFGVQFGEEGQVERDTFGAMWAVDVASGERVATFEWPYLYQSGVTVTAGGLILTSTPDGYVMAHDADTLDVLWSFWTGISSRGTPIVYEVNGKEYIAVLVGGPSQSDDLAWMLRGAMLYVFSL
jgi:alcohol dehydrogenase (cytochrome c)